MVKMKDGIDIPEVEGEIVVLCGGPGGEREVSLASGGEVHAALTRAGMACRLVDVPENNPTDFLERLDCGLAVMMLHGEFGEDGTAQEILERRGIPYSGSGPDACRLAMNKVAVKEWMLSAGVPTAKWALTDSAAAAAEQVKAAGLTYPLFVKPNNGGSSVGASRADNPEALTDAVALALACHGSDGTVLVEELINGREMTAGWVGGQLLPFIEMKAQNKFYDYDAKYKSDATIYHCPAAVEGKTLLEARRHVLAIVEHIGARDLARVDFILSDRGPMFLELNALPGFTSHSLVPLAARTAGISMEQLCVSLVAMAAARTIRPLRVLPFSSTDDDKEDESEIVDFQRVNWDRMQDFIGAAAE